MPPRGVNLRSRREAMRGGPYKIGEVVARTGLSAQALRYYEARGLLRAGRTAGGHRIFGVGVVERVRFIRRAEDLGFSLQEICELLDLARGGLAAGEARALVARYRRAIRARRRALSSLEDALAETARALADGIPDDAPAPATALFETPAPRSRRRRV